MCHIDNTQIFRGRALFKLIETLLKWKRSLSAVCVCSKTPFRQLYMPPEFHITCSYLFSACECGSTRHLSWGSTPINQCSYAIHLAQYLDVTLDKR